MRSKKTTQQKRSLRIIKKNNKTNNPGVLIPRFFLVVFAVLIFLFNFFVKVDVNAQDSKTAISIENLLAAHNAYRKSLDLGELTLNIGLNQSAQNKANEMLKENCWSHYCPANKSPWEYFDEAQYNYIYAGENLAEGYYNIEDVMSAWENSPTHLENIVKDQYQEIGFGIVSGNFLNNPDNFIIVVHFGTRPINDNSLSNKFIGITDPKDGDSLDTSEVSIKGMVQGFDSVNIVDNNILKGQADIKDGIFTYRLVGLQEGKNIIYADGVSSVLSLSSSKVEITYTAIEKVAILQSSVEPGLVVPSTTKNVVNLAFVAFFALIFFLDFIIVSRTKAINAFKSYSHYHFVLFIIVGLVILVGGFAGQIQNGLTI